ncbi:MAG: AAA family ATPase [Candidatus Stahlbacteria bacterium]|nr:AAA family ATPase [Candidatus Stahlbacteria bacterium]
MNLPIILGPTGVGKTAIAIEVAAKIGAEIVVCDSRQVYQMMDIGTNKPTQQEIACIKHWLIDIVPPDTTLNA